MSEVVCENCQEINPAGTTQCGLCGYPLPRDTAEPTPAPTPAEPAPATDAPATDAPAADAPTAAAPTAAAEEPSGRERCWNCAAEIPYHGNQRCRSCGQPVNPPPAVALRFPGGQVLVCDAGQSLALGRLGDHASVFVPYRNVSRRHARLTVDTDGTPWLDPVPDAPNGTFIDGGEIVRRIQLRDGQTVRFAGQLAGIVVIPPEPRSQEVL